MKVIDETGALLTAEPDLEAGYLVDVVETIHHDAVAGVEEVSHYEYKTYPNGGKDRWKVVDVPAVPAKEAYDEEVEVQRYVLYTAEELAQRKAEKEKADARQKALDALPETLATLQAAQTDTDSLMVDQEYRLTLLELGLDPEE